MNDANRAPLAAAMKAYAAGGALAFHTPGHKQGLGAHPLLRDFVTEEGLRAEVSLADELDDLHRPEGCLKEAQQKAARLWGADEAIFSVNGTTGAIHAMMLAALSPGDEVIVSRNIHRSVVGGLVLSGARPVYIMPERDEKVGIAHGVTAESVRQALAKNPAARAVFAVYPTYYGVASELGAIAKAAHEKGVPLLVDEAHGAHLKFSDELPPDALSCGADLVAQSTHKLLGAMTQASMLFRKGGRVPAELVRRSASLLATTSPNYLLMASLDIARLQMEEEGAERIARAVRLAKQLREEINALPGLWCFGVERMGRPGAAALDVTKLTVNVSGLGLSGEEAMRLLRGKNIQAELADARNVLFIVSMADTEREIERLFAALQELSSANVGKSEAAFVSVSMPPNLAAELSPRETFYAARESVPLIQAAGQIAAEEITFYPPGIPAVVPGERMTPEAVAYLREMVRMGMKVTGAMDASLSTVCVVKQGEAWTKKVN